MSVWASVSRRLFAGIITSTQYLGGTPYSQGAAKLTLGLGIGVRLGACDPTAATYLLDVLDGALDSSHVRRQRWIGEDSDSSTDRVHRCGRERLIVAALGAPYQLHFFADRLLYIGLDGTHS